MGAQTKISTMSFHLAKVMTCVEGGMIFTHKEKYATELRVRRNQGESAKYIHSHLGTNARMMDFCAAIGYFTRASSTRRAILFQPGSGFLPEIV